VKSANVPAESWATPAMTKLHSFLVRLRSRSAYHRAMDVEQRMRICHLIEGLIAADGVITPEEQDFMRRIVQRFDVPYPVAEAGPISDRPPVSDPGRAAALLRELDADVRLRVMALLVDSAVSDGVVHPQERAMLLVAAAALDVDAAALEERIAERLRRVTQGS
jgi:uncharacterized tellurite resistance protein B-like protein